MWTSPTLRSSAQPTMRREVNSGPLSERTLSGRAAPGVTYSQTAGNDTSITASVTVAPNAPNTNPISVTVRSQGFGGG
jgi:hypothetical protein